MSLYTEVGHKIDSAISAAGSMRYGSARDWLLDAIKLVPQTGKSPDSLIASTLRLLIEKAEHCLHLPVTSLPEGGVSISSDDNVSLIELRDQLLAIREKVRERAQAEQRPGELGPVRAVEREQIPVGAGGLVHEHVRRTPTSQFIVCTAHDIVWRGEDGAEAARLAERQAAAQPGTWVFVTKVLSIYEAKVVKTSLEE